MSWKVMNSLLRVMDWRIVRRLCVSSRLIRYLDLNYDDPAALPIDVDRGKECFELKTAS